jgi:hypothetical protein
VSVVDRLYICNIMMAEIANLNPHAIDLSLDLPDHVAMYQRRTRSQQKLNVCSLMGKLLIHAVSNYLYIMILTVPLPWTIFLPQIA